MGQSLPDRSVFQVPERETMIVCRGQNGAIGREGDRLDPALGWSRKTADLLARAELDQVKIELVRGRAASCRRLQTRSIRSARSGPEAGGSRAPWRRSRAKAIRHSAPVAIVLPSGVIAIERNRRSRAFKATSPPSRCHCPAGPETRGNLPACRRVPAPQSKAGRGGERFTIRCERDTQPPGGDRDSGGSPGHERCPSSGSVARRSPGACHRARRQSPSRSSGRETADRAGRWRRPRAQRS